MVTTLLLAGVLVALLTLLVLVVRLINDIKTAQRVSQGNQTIHPNSEPWEPTPRLTKEPPVFGGDSATFKEWTFAMDMALRSLALPNAAQRVDYAAGFLTGNARLWLIAALEANQVFSDWPALKAALGDVYGPRHNEETSRMGLITAAQRGSLDAYIAAFTRLSLQVPEIDHHTRALLFVRGLVPHIQRQVMREHPRTLEQAVMAAHTVEQSSGPPASGPPASRESRSVPSFRGQGLRKLTDQERVQLRAMGHCFACRKPGHLAKDCTEGGQRYPNAGRQ